MRVLPRKADFRMRAHINPLNSPFFPFPPHPAYANWQQHFPLHFGAPAHHNQLIYCNTREYPCSYQ
jgi:tRNA (guanine-N7-)-methyltransferase